MLGTRDQRLPSQPLSLKHDFDMHRQMLIDATASTQALASCLQRQTTNGVTASARSITPAVDVAAYQGKRRRRARFSASRCVTEALGREKSSGPISAARFCVMSEIAACDLWCSSLPPNASCNQSQR